ncbi:hypothetical protein [Leptospira neocaledonica]|uniref:Uncharacterized protein n=1 Tax=Leptospira neocaledonica TaxID=2023192 RepID=A0A2M9ZT92_9LEPT|nr:hypothetical protein [Leptospira neocaledonica]PJZ75318.1 hypothetical protein CH365_19550 [Leptospira neocaledonica]
MFPFTYKGKIRLARRFNDKEKILNELRQKFIKKGVEDFKITKIGLKIPSQITFNRNAVGFLNECEILVKENDENFYFEYCISFEPLFSVSIISLPLSVLAFLINGLSGVFIYFTFLAVPFVILYFMIIFEYLFVLFGFKE